MNISINMYKVFHFSVFLLLTRLMAFGNWKFRYHSFDFFVENSKRRKK